MRVKAISPSISLCRAYSGICLIVGTNIGERVTRVHVHGRQLFTRANIAEFANVTYIGQFANVRFCLFVFFIVAAETQGGFHLTPMLGVFCLFLWQWWAG